MSNVRNVSQARQARQQDKPSGVALNLDTLTRETSVEPFVVVIGGKAREFMDPNDMDWRDMMRALEDPRLIFQLALNEADFGEVMAQTITVYQMKTLTTRYMEWYGFDPGNLPASRT